MSRMKVGDQMPDFSFCTPFRSDRKLSQAVKAKKTAIVFLRYYGCTLCQYDIHKYAAGYDNIKKAGGEIMVVLQSDPKKLAADLVTEAALPFELICDPKQKLYRLLSIEAAKSKRKLAGPGTVIKMVKAAASGHKHGRYEGDELQLPAVFVIDRDLKVTYVHYGKTADDVPDIEKLAKL